MERQVKNDWIINNQNIFGLQQDINLSISSIQYEILNQAKGKSIKAISDYLGAKIDISKEIQLTKKLTIEKVFAKFLGFENINPLNQKTFNCSMILGYLQLSLFKEYSENKHKHKNILTFSDYKTQYNSLLNNFLTSNIDTDEQDFIKAELTLCNNLLIELNKPVYSVLSPFNEVLDKPCKYKENLINSIDKRKKFLEQKANEKYPKVKTLFQFIEYLHSNIKNFNQYNGLIKELEQLDKERTQLKPRNNYKDKLQYDNVQAELEIKFKTLQDYTANRIKAKAKELNVCSFENEPNYNFNGIETEITQLKKNFNEKDLPEIFKHKSQYLEYRSNTHGTFLSLQFFFDELDELTKRLFDYFKETEQNEFEAFETKAIPVNNITEALQGFKQGQTKFFIPTAMNETKTRILNNLADFIFFQIEVIADFEFEGKIYKDIKQKNNDSILKPENWEQHKETFFTQRIAAYKDSYTLVERIKLELTALEKLPINKTDYQILKDRYKEYLQQKQALPPQPIVKQKDELDETEISKIVNKHFRFFNLNCPRKHKQILKDADFEKLINWTIWYFENEFKVPEISEPIKVVNTNKTFVQLSFKYLFKELHKSSTYPPTLFEFYKNAFSPYSDDKENNFLAVKNNDEVKKLMQIDY